MSEDKVVQLDVQSPPTGTNGTDPAKDQREKSCGFGSCTFVAEWYRKMNEQETPVGPAGATIVSELRAEACPKCHGLFSNTSSLLPRIVLGRMDKLGHTIRQVYLSGEDYKIYRTRQGVNVNFADCREREREQRADYAAISQKLCRLRFLTSQMARWIFSERRSLRSGGFYDHQIAEAIHLALQGKATEARQILDTGLTLAEERLTNENRVRYLVACLLVGLAPAVGLWMLYQTEHLSPGSIWMPYLIGAAAGATGAVFSIALRVQDLDLKPFAQSVMNYVMGALRVLTGFVAGATILFIINGTVLGEGIVKVLTSPMSELSVESWKCILEGLPNGSCHPF